MGIKNYLATYHKPKIAIISDRVYPYFKGGAEKRYWEISKYLSEMGFKICYYTGCWPDMPKYLKVESIQIVGVYKVGKFYVNGRKSILETLQYTLGLFRFLALDSYDLIECEQFPIIPIFVCKIFSVLRRKGFVVTWHEVWGKELWINYLGQFGWIGYFLEALSVHLPHTLISVSDHTTQRLAELYKVPLEKIVTIPNGIDFQWDRRLNHKLANYKDKRNFFEKRVPIACSDIIFVGRLLEHKNVDKLIKAVGILREDRPNIKCLIIGDGPEREGLEQLTYSLCLQKNVNFEGCIENEKRVYSFMEASRIFVFPSTREGFGISVIEANACGLPALVINTEDNAARDLIENGRNGFTCQLDEYEMAQKISHVLSTPRSKYSESSRNLAKKYCWEEIGKQIAWVYDGLISRNVEGFLHSNKRVHSLSEILRSDR